MSYDFHIKQKTRNTSESCVTNNIFLESLVIKFEMDMYISFLVSLESFKKQNYFF